MADNDDACELMIGAGRDPIFGSTIMLGAGESMIGVLRVRSLPGRNVCRLLMSE